MAYNKYVAVVCAAILGMTSVTLVSCSNDDAPGESNNISADQTEQSENYSEEPSTPEAVLDAYKLATATITGSLKINDMDDATLTRIFSIYYAANDQWDAAYADTISQTQGEDLDVLAHPDFSLSDFIPEDDQRFLDKLCEDIGFDQRVLIDEVVANAKYDLFYFTLATSLSGDDSMSEEAASAVDGLSIDAVTINDDNTAYISLPVSGGKSEAVLKRDNGTWKLFMDKDEAFEVSTLGRFMLGMLTVEAEGDTPEQKAQFMVTQVRDGFVQQMYQGEVEDTDDIIDAETH